MKAIFKASSRLPMVFKKSKGVDGLAPALQQLCQEASKAIRQGATILILSDRSMDAEHVAIPALLATAAVHHHLIREGTRTKVGLAVETGEARELHHFALLIGYGAGAIKPYMAFRHHFGHDRTKNCCRRISTFDQAVKNYVKSTRKGMLKIIAKMGISTIQSYRGAQIFEAVGLNSSVIDKYFTNTAVARGRHRHRDDRRRDAHASSSRVSRRGRRASKTSTVGGFYQWRKEGEFHMVNPNTIHKLQYATRTNNRQAFKEFSRLIDERNHNLATLRGLMKIKFAEKAIPVEEVESAASIVKRFCTGAMSFGSISREAHESLAIAMNRLGGRSNTGEGGEDAGRFKPLPNGDTKRSKIKQVAIQPFLA